MGFIFTEDMVERCCTKCGTIKPIAQFRRQGYRTRKDGSVVALRKEQCKDCLHEQISKTNKAYRERNLEAIRERQRTHYHKHKVLKGPRESKPPRTVEEARAYQRAYYQANKEKLKAYAREYAKNNKGYYQEYVRANKEQINQKRAEWRKENAGKIRAYTRENMAKRFAENPDKVRAARREKKKQMKAKDPQAWNAKMAKYNAPCQKRMVEELHDCYIRALLVKAHDKKDKRIMSDRKSTRLNSSH